MKMLNQEKNEIMGNNSELQMISDRLKESINVYNNLVSDLKYLKNKLVLNPKVDLNEVTDKVYGSEGLILDLLITCDYLDFINTQMTETLNKLGKII